MCGFACNLGHALCLPVPEKTQKQFNFCIIPEYADGITPPPEGVTGSDCMVFTVADGPAKAAFTGLGQQIGHNEGETAEGLIRKLLNDTMPNTNVVRPDERQFVSAMPEAHRKGEKAYHVKAFRGSKEGMYPLRNAPGRLRLSFWSIMILTYLFLIRVSFLPVYRNSVCFQEAPFVLLLRHHRFRFIYVCSSANIQS